MMRHQTITIPIPEPLDEQPGQLRLVAGPVAHLVEIGGLALAGRPEFPGQDGVLPSNRIACAYRRPSHYWCMGFLADLFQTASSCALRRGLAAGYNVCQTRRLNG